jgi:hypothetical protein
VILSHAWCRVDSAVVNRIAVVFAILHKEEFPALSGACLLRLRVLILAFAASGLLAADRASLAGKILDGAGHPIDHAIVLVYHAGVKRGYSTYCPSCYVDCGKRTTTGPDGSFLIKSVDSGLLFELLAVRDGFQPAFIKAVDPLKQSSPSAVLIPRYAATSPEKVVRGRVVDGHGLPLRDSLVQPIGLSSNEYPDGKPSKGEISMYGTIQGVDPIAVTDEKGEFEIASERPALAMLLKFETRGFAPKLQAFPTGMTEKRWWCRRVPSYEDGWLITALPSQVLKLA